MFSIPIDSVFKIFRSVPVTYSNSPSVEGEPTQYQRIVHKVSKLKDRIVYPPGSHDFGSLSLYHKKSFKVILSIGS